MSKNNKDKQEFAGVYSVHGTNPQYLVDKIVRMKIFQNTYTEFSLKTQSEVLQGALFCFECRKCIG